MNKRTLMALLLLAPSTGPADGQWILEQSTLTYHVSHPLHQSEGVSHAARGKGVCHAGQCDFLIAAPVKSFDSGDSNRDLHMLQVTRGAQFPLVTVRTRLPEAALESATILCRSGDRVRRPDRPVQAGSIPTVGARQPDTDIGDHSGDAVRFQDRPAVVPGGPRQERNAGARGDDLASRCECMWGLNTLRGGYVVVGKRNY